MKVLELPFQNNNNLFSAYRVGKSEVQSLFDYLPFADQSYIDRWKELQERTFPRKSLHEHLISYHHPFPASKKTYENIDKLLDPSTTVVVTGQQAGLLTGPMYTIHKCLSTIIFAKEKQRELGTPVIPVFWIAGEDHDFEEINHINLPDKNQLKKRKLKLNEGARSVTHIKADNDKLMSWSDEVMRSFGETEHTQKVKELIQTAIKETESLTDFFAYLMLSLFKDSGLVLLDSHHPDLRIIEASFFEKMIRKNEQVDAAFQAGSQSVQSLGYPSPIESEKDNSHLFIEERGVRVLLQRDDNSFRGKNNECLYSTDELLEVSRRNPEKLSNNVITRPLMQELLLPTLAFVAGPGEINYWSTLKPVFHCFETKMPPVLPRLSLVLLDRYTQKVVEEKKLDIEDVIENGINDKKEKWLDENTEIDLDHEINQTLKQLKVEHDQLKEKALSINRGLRGLTEKNWTIIEDHILFLKKKIEQSIYTKHENELKKFEHIAMHIHPDDQPQERTMNIFYYINQFGFDFITELQNQQFVWNGNPKAIKL